MSGELFESEPKRDGFAHDIDRENGKEEWLTPPEIFKAFGPFDLDPCAPVNRPWPTAAKHFTIEDNGLIKPWNGYVFCNPPYGNKTGDWLKRCAEHNDCLVLIFARTETAAFQEHVWPHARSLFFIKGRLSFYHVDGTKGGAAGAPSVLVAYGEQADKSLRENISIPGHYLPNQRVEFEVEITETLSLVKKVQATSRADAERYVQALYRAEEIILTADNSKVDCKVSAL